MADTDTLGLAAASALTGSEKVHIVQGGVSKQADVGEIAALVAASPSTFGAKWELISSWTYSAGVAQVAFTDLGNYKELLIIARDIVLATSGSRDFQLSVNNGSTYYNTTSDYLSIANTGVPTGRINAAGHATATTAARTVFLHLLPNINGTPKLLRTSYENELFVGSLSPVNAVRILPSAGGNITGGSAFCLGLR